MLFACFESLMHRIIIIIGLVCWSLVTLGGSFANSFEGLLAARCFSGLGEAVFGSLCPAIISDLFAGDDRAKMLLVYFTTTFLGWQVITIINRKVVLMVTSWSYTVMTGFFYLMIQFSISVDHSDAQQSLQKISVCISSLNGGCDLQELVL